jgi:LmbE family N-acetylglucosaminyl deacetylase
MAAIYERQNPLPPVTGMHKVSLGQGTSNIRRILSLGAHSDDIEIGCGGTILRLIHNHPNLQFLWAVFSANPVRKREALRSARKFLQGTERSQIVVRDFRDGFFPYEGKRIKEFVASLAKKFQPDLIFTHYRNDLHQDHRVISDLTWNEFRNHFILEYEIPKYDGDLGSPNFFVALDEAVCERKIQYILKGFRSQTGKRWFTEDTFRALLRIRGVESNAESAHAEAFFCRKAAI